MLYLFPNGIVIPALIPTLPSVSTLGLTQTDILSGSLEEHSLVEYSAPPGLMSNWWLSCLSGTDGQNDSSAAHKGSLDLSFEDILGQVKPGTEISADTHKPAHYLQHQSSGICESSPMVVKLNII